MPMPELPGRRRQLTIVVVTYNSGRHVDALLDSIPAAAHGLDYEVVVVDNASTDDSCARVQTHADVTLLRSAVNLGYSGAINLARDHCQPRGCLAVLNPDLVLRCGTLTALVGELEADTSIGVAAPRLFEEDGRTSHHLRMEPSVLGALGDALLGSRWASRPRVLTEFLRRPSDYTADHDVDWAGAAAWVIAPDCHRAVANWDEQTYFLFSEETDYAHRARQAGFRIRYIHSAAAEHEGSGSGQSPELMALLAVNRVRYYERRHRRGQAAAFRAAVALNHLLRARRRQDRAALRYVVRRASWDDLPGATRPARSEALGASAA